MRRQQQDTCPPLPVDTTSLVSIEIPTAHAVFDFTTGTLKLTELESALHASSPSALVIKNSLIARINEIREINPVPIHYLDRLLICFQQGHGYLTGSEKLTAFKVLQQHIETQPSIQAQAIETYCSLADGYYQTQHWQASLLCYRYAYYNTAKASVSNNDSHYHKHETIAAKISEVLESCLLSVLTKQPFSQLQREWIDNQLHKSKQATEAKDFITQVEEYLRWAQALQSFKLSHQRAKEIISCIDVHLSSLNQAWPERAAIKKRYDAHLWLPSSTLKTAEKPTFWLQWQARLASARANETGKAFSGAIQALSADIMLTCHALLGVPNQNMPWTSILLGSWSRQDAGPYSDIEGIFLIADESLIPYMQALKALFEFFILSLGESHAGELMLPFPEGLRIDHYPIYSLSQLQEKLSSGFATLEQEPILWSLLTPAYLYGDQRLFKDYQALLAQTVIPDTFVLHHSSTTNILLTQYYAILQLQQDSLSFLPDQSTPAIQSTTTGPINLKTKALKPLTLLLTALGLYYQLETIHPVDIIEGLITKKVLATDDGNLLKLTLNFLYQQRWHAHLFCGRQNDEIHLTGEQAQRWSRYQHFIIHPLLNWAKNLCLKPPTQPKPFTSIVESLGVSQTTPIAILGPAVTSLLAQATVSKAEEPEDDVVLLTELTTLLRDNNSPLATYLALYQQCIPVDLWDKWMAVLEQHKVQTSILEALRDYPASDGYRVKIVWEEQQLRQSIQQFCYAKQQKPKTTASHSVVLSLQLPEDPEVYLIEPALVEHWVELSTGQIKSSPEEELGMPSRHRVARVQSGDQALYIKQKPDHPMMDAAIYQLRQRLFGHGAPANLLAKLTVANTAANPNHRYSITYPVLISTAVGGRDDNLTQHLKATQPLRWSMRHFFELVLFDALTHPGDGSPRNYQVQTGPNGLQTLVCIDNDQYFVAPVVEQWQGQKIQLRSILFCFAELLKPLNQCSPAEQTAIEALLIALLKLDVKSLLKNWLQALIARESTYLKLFPVNEREQGFQPDRDQNFVTIPLLLREGLVFRLGTDLLNLQAQAQQALRTNQLFSAYEVVEQLHSVVAYSYQQVLLKTTLTPLARFKAISESAQISKTSSQSLYASLGKIPSWQEIEKDKIYAPINALEELALLDAMTLGPHIKIFSQAQEAYLYLNFAKNALSEKKQANMLALLQERRFTHIEISHSEGLTDVWLTQLLQHSGKALKHLKLRHCKRITSASVLTILKFCPHLETLCLNYNAAITAITIVPLAPSWASKTFFNQAPLPVALTYLNISHNPNVESLQIEAPQLTTLKLKNCGKLASEKVSFKLPALKTVDTDRKEFYSPINLTQNRSKNADYDALFKILMIGASGVGKSQILQRYIDDTYIDSFLTTIGIDFKVKTIFINGVSIKLQIWDTAGAERFGVITTAYYRGAHVLIVVFDLIDFRSFNKNAKNFIQSIKEYASKNTPFLLVGNKCDLVEKRQVTREQAETYAKEIGAAQYIECSAKTGKNVSAIFEAAAKLDLTRWIKKEYPSTEKQQKEALLAENRNSFWKNQNTAQKTQLKSEQERHQDVSTLKSSDKDNIEVEYDYLIKIVMRGPSMVGKTAILWRYICNSYTAPSKGTVGVEFGHNTILVDGSSIELQIWDTCGVISKIVSKTYYRGAHVLIVVFDLTDLHSFNEGVKNFIQDIKENAAENMPFLLVGNKYDVVEWREVTREQAETYAKEVGAAQYIECSAKTGENISAFFEAAAKLGLTTRLLKKEHPLQDTKANHVPSHKF